MSDENLDPLLEMMRSEYNPPPETPREEMWSVIQQRIQEGMPGGARAGREEAEGDGPKSPDGPVLSLDQARRRLRARTKRGFTWAMGAAAILVLGLGIGRMTAPGVAPSMKSGLDATSLSARATSGDDSDPLRVVSLEHLAQTESYLTLARADARAGALDAGVGRWSRSRLAQTRLLLDAQQGKDPVLQALLEDLELVLVQLMGASAVEGDATKTLSEWNLAMEGLEDTEVLARIRAMLPSGPGYMGS